MNNIKLTPITSPDGSNDLVYSSDTDETEMEITPNNFMSFTIHNQGQLEAAMKKVERYQVDNLWIKVFRDNVSLDFSDIPYINKIKTLEFDIAGKKFSLNILPKDHAEITSVTWLTFHSEHPYNFDQFDVFTKLIKLDITGHVKTMSWTRLSHLIDLYIFKLKVDDLTAFSGLTSLKRLHLQRISIKSLKGIGDLPNLETLYVDDLRYLTDVSNLVDAKSLENIRFIPFKKVTDWDFLVNMPQLKLIGLDVAESVSFMEQMPNLVCAWCVKVKDESIEILNDFQIKYGHSPIWNEQFNQAFTVKRFVEGH